MTKQHAHVFFGDSNNENFHCKRVVVWAWPEAGYARVRGEGPQSGPQLFRRCRPRRLSGPEVMAVRPRELCEGVHYCRG